MKIRKIAGVTAAACTALCFGGAAMAAPNILGFDDMSCATWIKSKDDPDQRNAYISWLRGFLTGHNYALPNQQVATISSGTIEAKISQYCKENRDGNISDGVMRLSDQFSGRNQPIRK